jgi:hypothetical protein
VSQRVRIIALCALVALVAVGGGLFLLGGGQSSPEAATQIKPLHPVKHHIRPTATKTAKKTTKVVKKTPAAPKKAVRVHVKTMTPSVIDGMPGTLALELQTHEVVVVALYAPKSSVDAIVLGEARQGAAEAGAGFVALNVTNEKVAAPLTSLLTTGASAADRVLDDPAVLVFQRPRTLFVRLSGYTDRDTVAQAATNAAAAPTPS